MNRYVILLDCEHMTVTNGTMTIMKKCCHFIHCASQRIILKIVGFQVTAMLPNFNLTCNSTTLSTILGTTLILHPYGNWALTITFLMAPLFFSRAPFFPLTFLSPFFASRYLSVQPIIYSRIYIPIYIFFLLSGIFTMRR